MYQNINIKLISYVFLQSIELGDTGSRIERLRRSEEDTKRQADDNARIQIQVKRHQPVYYTFVLKPTKIARFCFAPVYMPIHFSYI